MINPSTESELKNLLKTEKNRRRLDYARLTCYLAIPIGFFGMCAPIIYLGFSRSDPAISFLGGLSSAYAFEESINCIRKAKKSIQNIKLTNKIIKNYNLELRIRESNEYLF